MRPSCLLPVALLAACGEALVPSDPCPPTFALAEDGQCAFDEEAVLELVRTFDDGGLVRVNDEPFEQIYGTLIQRNVWITPLPLPGGGTAATLYAGIDPDDNVTPLAQDFPTGTVIVHEAIDREEGHGVQIKREEGWVGEDGRDWWFGKIFDDGSYDPNECSPCEMCHSDANRPMTDGLVGVTRDAMPR